MAPGYNGKRKRVMLSSGSYYLPTPRRVGKITQEEYALYLEGEHWAQVKEDYAASGLPQECFVCHDPKFELHHLNYDCLGVETWDDLVPLCRKHHQQAHRQVKAGAPLAEAHKYLEVKIYTTRGGAVR